MVIANVPTSPLTTPYCPSACSMKSYAISLDTNVALFNHKGEEQVSPFAASGQRLSLLLMQWNDIRSRLHESLEPGAGERT